MLPPTWVMVVLFVYLIIVLILDIFSLIKAAKKKNWGWFWVILFTNTLGILEIYYLFIHKKRKKRKR